MAAVLDLRMRSAWAPVTCWLGSMPAGSWFPTSAVEVGRMGRREGSDLPGGPGLRLGVAPDAATPSRRPTAPHPLPPEGGRLPAGGTGSRQRLEPAEHPPHGTQLLGHHPPHHRLELVDLHAFRRRRV